MLLHHKNFAAQNQSQIIWTESTASIDPDLQTSLQDDFIPVVNPDDRPRIPNPVAEFLARQSSQEQFPPKMDDETEPTPGVEAEEASKVRKNKGKGKGRVKAEPETSSRTH